MGSIIKNYRLGQFLRQPQDTIDEYTYILRHLKPIDTKTPLMQLPLIEVDNIKTNLEADLLKIVATVQDTTEKQVLKMKILDFFGVVNSIRNQIETIIRAEQKLQSQYPDPKWEMVGGSEKMARFGIYNTTIALAEQFNTSPQEIEQWQYGHVFTILLHNVTRHDLQHQMSKIKTLK
ncbi:hypothetical protein V1387_12710 [Allomuricauda taeanensis]|uniref:hypothetical protein n=1 Tax=Flagellimonas taeanensis TaxID=1005926 RepID=UPI002E7AF03C|nr:hypothetical protein [Allomuricauda taeanensis]MEE1963551.1 hypothetical protein [Allomuricauda taeanensis]